jgi:hypothetical protein
MAITLAPDRPPPTQHLALVCLLFRVDWQTMRGYAAVRTIAADAGVAESTVKAAIAWAAKRGLVVQVDRGYRGRASTWELRLPPAAIANHRRPRAITSGPPALFGGTAPQPNTSGPPALFDGNTSGPPALTGPAAARNTSESPPEYVRPTAPQLDQVPTRPSDHHPDITPAPGRGPAAAAARDDDVDPDDFEAERRRQLDLLAAWTADHPDAEPGVDNPEL